MANEKAQFVEVNLCVQTAMADLGENSMAMYPRYLSIAIRGVNELGFDVLKNVKRKLVGVDTTTKSALLPTDYVNYTRVGFINQGNEVQDLTVNPNLAFTVTEDNCKEVSRHCDCGCTDEACALANAVETTFENVTINGTVYQNSTSICTKSDGTIVQRKCIWSASNPTRECQYSMDLGGFPSAAYSNITITLNGQQVFIGYAANFAALKVIFESYGWTDFTYGGITFLAQTPNVWGVVTFDVLSEQTSFVLTPGAFSCVNPTPTVTQYCYDAEICEAEVADCGCITITDTVVNTLQSWGVLSLEFISRYRKGLDWQQTFKQPLSYFGYFNIDIYSGVIQLDQTYPFDSVYLEYYSANEIDGGDYLIPVFAQEAVAAYIKYKATFNKNNISMQNKLLYRKDYYNQKNRLRNLLNPVRLKNIMDIFRSVPPVRP